jgi:predicted O-methyltransferase YrrM
MQKEFVEPGDLYSVIPKIDMEYKHNYEKIYNNIDYNYRSHLNIIKKLTEELKDFDKHFGYPVDDIKTEIEFCEILSKLYTEKQDNNYYLMNGSFEWMDARMLYYFIKTLKPKNIIEIGCGHSTKLMVQTKKIFNLDTEITCIEPYPSEFIKSFESSGDIKLISSPLETVDKTVFDNLCENDILFIDSSHVGKIGSDVLYYFNIIFPMLSKGVYIHIHDIFLPMEYPDQWIKSGRFWNEQYFLYNFLQYNNKFKIIFGSSYCQENFKKSLINLQKDSYENKYLKGRNNESYPYSGGSMWIVSD